VKVIQNTGLQDIYEGVTTKVKSEEIDEFGIRVGVYRGSVMSLCLFSLVIKTTNDIQGVGSWCVMFKNDAVLLEDNLEEVKM